jgi:hypothetical protein
MTEEMRLALTEIFNQHPQPRHLRSRADRFKNGTLQLASAVRVLQDNGYTVTITIKKTP